MPDLQHKRNQSYGMSHRGKGASACWLTIHDSTRPVPTANRGFDTTRKLDREIRYAAADAKVNFSQSIWAKTEIEDEVGASADLVTVVLSIRGHDFPLLSRRSRSGSRSIKSRVSRLCLQPDRVGCRANDLLWPLRDGRIAEGSHPRGDRRSWSPEATQFLCYDYGFHLGKALTVPIDKLLRVVYTVTYRSGVYCRRGT